MSDTPTQETQQTQMARRFMRLTDAQRQAVYARMREEGLSMGQFPILPREGQAEDAPLSYAQMRQWFLWQMEPQGSAYHITGAFLLQGALDIPALEAAWCDLVGRHAALRTVFHADAGGQVSQAVLPHTGFSVQRLDLASLPEPERIVRAEAAARACGETPFDLGSGPLLRVLLIGMGGSEHRLVVAMHHIVSDGWSLGVLVESFADRYRAHHGGVADAPVHPMALQYADYAHWQRQWMEAGEKDRQLAYWRESLGAAHPVLQLPADHARRADGRYRAALHAWTLAPALAHALRAAAQAWGATPFMALLAAFQVALYRWSGQDDVRVGVPVANRGRVETEGLVGLFVNTQVLRVRLHGRMPLADVLAAVRDAALGAQAHQDLPFDQLVEALQPERSLAAPPLFQVMFNHQQHSRQALDGLPGLQFVRWDLPGQTAQFELTLGVVEDGQGGLRMEFHYARELFGEATILRMARHYEAVLQALADAPATCVGDIGLLADEEARQLKEWGECPRDEPHAEPVHRGFERMARLQPGAVAVELGEHVWSYRDLDRRANHLAHRLAALGAGPECRVGIAMERSPELVAGLLAILKTGAAFVPLDPAYPADRLAHMARDCGMALLLTGPALAGRIPLPPGVPCLALECQGEEHDAPPAAAVGPHHLAYMIYTSGSTGLPKGVMVEHGAFAAHCIDTAACYEMGPGSRELHFLSFAFDGAHERLFTALTCGAAVVLRDGQLWTAEQTLQALGARRITNAGFPPAYLGQLADWAGRTGEAPALDLISFGGEAMSRDGFDAVRRHLRPRLLINGYGPTEAVVTPMLWKVDSLASFSEAYAPIGRPMPGRKAYVLDAHLQPVPRHVPGELYLGGSGIARGYGGRAGLTAERFVADPFGSGGGRLYRTGDWVRWREDGQLEYLGRVDHQVKVRGFRIELGEIEAVLRTANGVGEAVVVARETPRGTRLAAYAAPRAGGTLEPDALRAHLARSLPDYMVPSAVVVLERLPVGPGGKVDRKALPEPAEPAPAEAGGAPQGAAEQALEHVWCDVLGRERVGRDDNFFELGGDSILSLQIVARLRLAGWRVTPRQLFERQTIAQLAAVAEPLPTGAIASAGPARGEVPLLPFQRDFFAMPMPARHHWNQALLLRSPGPLNATALRHALRAVGQHHDALRLRVVLQPEGHWVQRYAEVSPAQWDDMLWVHAADGPAQLSALCEQAQCSLDLEHGPLLRAVAIAMPGGDARLLLVAHHLIVDGVSWRILLEDLQQAYAHSLEEGAAALPPASSGLREWVQVLQRHGENHPGEIDHWASLSGCPSALPCARPGAAGTAAHQQTVSIRLDRETTEAFLAKAPAAYRTQANDLLLTALGRALCRWSGQPRILVDMEGHGREDLDPGVDLSRTVGWFTSLYPVALDAQGPLPEAVRRVKESLRRVPHRGVGYGALRHFGTPAQQASLQALPRAQVVFNYLGQFDDRPQQEGQRWTLAPEPAGASVDAGAPLTHEFALNGRVLGGELSVEALFSGARHDAATVRGWMQDFEAELRALITHCAQAPQGATPSDFPLAGLDQAGLDALGLDWRHVEDLYLLSPMQAGLVFQTLLDPDAPAYRNQLRIDFEDLDAGRLRAAWAAAFERHAVLRSGVLTQSSRPLQWVARGAGLPWREIDARGKRDAAGCTDALASEELAKGLGHWAPPLSRFVLVRTGERSHHFIWTVHHVLLDGWSTSQLMAEVLRHYGGAAEPVPASRYGDYIRWLQGRDAAADRAHWLGALHAVDGPTRLVEALPPAGSGQGGSPAAEAGRARHAFDEPSTARLLDFARRERITLNTLVQGAWALLLQRYTGQDTVVFGTTVAGRPAELAGVEHMVGLFINTLPLACSPRSDARAGDWLRGLQAQGLQAREHEHTPLYEIQRWAGAEAGGLFDTLLVFENYPVDDALVGALPAGLRARVTAQREETHYPLTVLALLEPVLSLQLRYDPARIAPAVAAMLMGHLARCLQWLSGDAERCLGTLDLLSPQEVQQVEERGRTVAAVDGADTLHRMFERQAALQPGATALRFEGDVLGYGDLDRRANRLAHHLAALGVRPESRVGVALGRGTDLVVALLAVLKAGAAYVPLDPDYPPDRIAYMARDSGMACVVTQAGLWDVSPLPDTVAVVDLGACDLSCLPDTAPEVAVHPDHLAYVIYTSGSTGRPKGAQLCHRQVVRLLRGTEDRFRFGPHDVWTLFHSYAFDFSVWEIFGALCTGGQLVVVPYWVSRSPQDFLALLRERQVTVLNQTPSAFGQLVGLPATYEGRADGTQDLALRVVIFGGEALDPQRLRPWIAHFGDDRPALVNMYGITETTVHVTWRRITRADLQPQRSPVGTAIGDLGLFVLDGDLRPVPPGAPGELFVSGAGLARGYLHQPALTAQRFVAHPLPGHAGERLYRTGDRVRWTAAGELEYLGRIDHQVKVRGFRIELGEIEAQLLAQPEVREAIVVAEDGPAGARLVAHVSAQPGRHIDVPLLRERLGDAMPDYMVPAAVLVSDGLPLTPNGKVDRKALPSAHAPHACGEIGEPPRHGAEHALAALWCEVLQLEAVGRNDHFFERGGHSLLAVQLVAAIQRDWGRAVALRTVFETPVLADLAARLAAEGALPPGEATAGGGDSARRINALLGELEL
ncbi:amino acid adenylation domain-containing protein [Acidovorax sp. GBBC 3334]|uniref:non-ribosomal peptide synthetase n=1 Tax=Acidovorax sp. GBBC 3334 TaxID=2940496 RepID=UPI0023033F6B|nr:non-ribosomal peptide synthetase [Acidovorax sp. GBBC 3334]MDA8457079.1 amino acid adenylation domain-containing protein [Acidovorax sp. GBBC 3334]